MCIMEKVCKIEAYDVWVNPSGSDTPPDSGSMQRILI